MTWKNTADRYGSLSIGLHWLIFFLLVGVYACIELREIYPKGSEPRETLKTWHFMLGLTVWTVAWIRLVSKLVQVSPRDSDPSGWQKGLATTVHVALYALILIMPVGGWLILSAEGDTIPFWGLELPSLIGENETTAENIEEFHETLGTIGYFLIGFHTLAALFHHYVVKDDILRRMLPKWK